PKEERMSEQRLRVGVIGCGLIAQVVHLPNLARLADRFSVDHVCDLSPTVARTVAERLGAGVRASTDWRDVVADPSLDAVIVLTPGAHGPIASGALAAGRHVLSEKPLVVTQAEAEALGALAATQGKVLQVGYMKLFDPGIARARALLPEIGTLRLVRITVRHPSDERQTDHFPLVRGRDADREVIAAAEAYERERELDALGVVPAGIGELYRGVFLGSVVHELSAMRGLGLELPTAFRSARAWPFDPQATGTEPPSIVALADLPGGALLDLAWLWVPGFPEYDETIELIGTTGSIVLRMPQPYGPQVAAPIVATLQDGPLARRVELASDRDSGFLEELRAFHATVTAGAPNRSDAEGARRDTAALQALAAALAATYGVTAGGEAAAVPA
ncbi:MAG: Gfo/Idh/MocA family protein, partial [Chloroflexota bacterium]